MTPLQIFGLIFCGLTIVWLIVEIAIFNTRLQVNKFIPTSIPALCQNEQYYLLQRMIDITKNEPECNKLMKYVQKTVTAYEIKPIIYVITPTYARPVQKAELTRLSHTLLLVPNVHWIVVEDSENKTALVTNFLSKTRLSFTHLNIKKPLPVKKTKDDSRWVTGKGVFQRNIALSWLRSHTDPTSKGVVYFADDDNTYDLEIFEEMRFTKKVSVWPVGLVGGLMVERPLVKNGKVVGWKNVWKASRPFPIDMAGFSVNLTLLLNNPKADFTYSVPEGYQESHLLKYLVTVDELEPKADNCTKVLVWHTRAQYPNLNQERKLSIPSNLNIEV